MTLNELIGREGLQAGETYTVEGPEGGIFHIVDDPSYVPDFGTVFIPTEGSVESYVQVQPRHQNFPLQLTQEGEFLAEDVAIEFVTEDGTYIDIYEDNLHGVENFSQYNWVPMLNLAEGYIIDRRRRLTANVQEGSDITIHYRTTESTLRIVREERLDGVPQIVKAAWWGITPEREDIQGWWNWMMYALYQNEHDWNTVMMQQGTHNYSGPMIAHNVTIYGVGGTEATEVEHFGQTWIKVQRVEEEMATVLLATNATEYAFVNLGLRPTNRKQILRQYRTNIRPLKDETMFVHLEDIILDGDWEGHKDDFEYLHEHHRSRLDNEFRNAPSFTGLNFSNHGGVDITMGQEIFLTNVAVVGYIATGIIGNVRNRWTGVNVLLGDAPWNHTLYNTNGDWTNLTTEGIAWGHFAWTAGTIRNFYAMDARNTPYRSGGGAVIGLRGGDFPTPEDSPNRAVPLGTTIDRFIADRAVVAGLGPQITLKNGVQSQGPLFIESGNGHQRSLYDEMNLLNNIIYIDERRGSRALGSWNYKLLNMFDTQILLHPDSTDDNPRISHYFQISSGRRNHTSWDGAKKVLNIDGFHSDIESHFIATFSASEDGVPVEVNVRDFTFNNRTTTLFRGPNGQGRLEDVGIDPDVLKERVVVNFVDGTLRLNSNYWRNLQIFFHVSRFHNVVDEHGRTSEVAETVLMPEGWDGGTFDVQPGLMWEPAIVDSPYEYEVLLENGTPMPEGLIVQGRRNPIIRFHVPPGVESFEFSASLTPVDEREPDMDNCQEQLDACQAQNEYLETLVEEARNELAEVVEENEHLGQILEDLQYEFDELNIAYTDLLDIYQDAMGYIVELRREVEEANRFIDGQRDIIRSLEEEIARLNHLLSFCGAVTINPGNQGQGQGQGNSRNQKKLR